MCVGGNGEQPLRVAGYKEAGGRHMSAPFFSLFRRLFVGAVGAAGRAGARGGGGLLSPPWLRATQHLCVLGVSGS